MSLLRLYRSEVLYRKGCRYSLSNTLDRILYIAKPALLISRDLVR